MDQTYDFDLSRDIERAENEGMPPREVNNPNPTQAAWALRMVG